MPAAEIVPSGAYAELPGVKLWFTDSGGAGVPIVLLHPNTGTVEIWQPQIAAFAAAGYRVIAFDPKGWGKSLADPASGPQPGSIAGDLDAATNHLKRRYIHLLGATGGGFRSVLDRQVALQGDRRFHRPHRVSRDQEAVSALPGF